MKLGLIATTTNYDNFICFDEFDDDDELPEPEDFWDELGLDHF